MSRWNRCRITKTVTVSCRTYQKEQEEERHAAVARRDVAKNTNTAVKPRKENRKQHNSAHKI